jgi:pimeloyl-ACP methyl ester carboxylesterase
MSNPDFQDGYADVNGVRLHYVSAGQGELILFAHGFPEYWRMWKDQLAEFGKDHRAVAFDMRGYNLSSKPEGVEDYGIDALVEDFRALADHLGYEKFTLVAHDWGGIVAWQFASRYPEYLDRLIIINAPHPGIFARLLVGEPEQQQASQYMRMFRLPGVEEMLMADDCSMLLDAIQTEATNFSDEDRRGYVEAWTRPGALTGGLNYYRAMPFEPLAVEEIGGEAANEIGNASAADFLASTPRELLQVDVPTLVIWGELDTALTIHNLDGLDEYISDLTIERVPDASHWVVSEQPELVNRLVRNFIVRA